MVEAPSERTVALFGLAFHPGPAHAALAACTGLPGLKLIVTSNIDHVLSLADNVEFRRAYLFASVRTLDGMPLIWLARLRGERGVSRVTGHDLLNAVLDDVPASASRVFVVSPNAAVSEGITQRLGAAGWAPSQIAARVPPFGFERDVAYGEKLANDIRRHSTTLLLMGVGAPKSEIWSSRMASRLGAPLVLCIGEALAVGAGQASRAPRLLQRTGLEWLWRFALSPRRLFHRYFIRSWRFPLIALRNPDLGRT